MLDPCLIWCTEIFSCRHERLRRQPPSCLLPADRQVCLHTACSPSLIKGDASAFPVNKHFKDRHRVTPARLGAALLLLLVLLHNRGAAQRGHPQVLVKLLADELAVLVMQSLAQLVGLHHIHSQGSAQCHTVMTIFATGMYSAGCLCLKYPLQIDIADGMQGLMQLVDLQHTHQHTVSIATL